MCGLYLNLLVHEALFLFQGGYRFKEGRGSQHSICVRVFCTFGKIQRLFSMQATFKPMGSLGKLISELFIYYHNTVFGAVTVNSALFYLM